MNDGIEKMVTSRAVNSPVMTAALGLFALLLAATAGAQSGGVAPMRRR